jgi:hypothetical protein
MDKKVTGRTDQGTKKYPGDEAYKKLFAKMLEEDKKKEKKKSEKKISAKESKGLLKADDSSIKKIHGTISKLTGHVRKAVIRIGSLEKKADKIEGRANKIEEKTSKIVNILKSQKSKIGEKLPGSNRDSLNKTLIETNKILVDIQKQLTLQSKDEEKQQKEKSRKDSVSESKKKLKAEESLLEKTSKGIGKVVGKVASKTLEPISGIFDKIMSFIALIGAGIATNAALEWLKDDKNREKIGEWFGWIKDHWKWVLAGLGAIALLPVIGAISGLLSPLGIIVGLLGKAVPLLLSFLLNPLTLKAMLAIGAGVLIYKGGEILFKEVRKIFTGSQGFSDAHDKLDQKLRDADLDPQGRTLRTGRRNRGGRPEITEEQIKVRDSVMEKRKQLKELSKNMTEEIKSERSKIMGGTMGRSATKAKSGKLSASKLKITQKYEARIPSIMGTNIEARKMGGPVMAGKPYLVGEGGPELFSPNVNGSVISNYKTEKMYQMLSFDMNQGGGINMIELPPITNQMPPPEIPVPTQQATDVPEISSTNMTDPYRQLSPLLYGITV